MIILQKIIDIINIYVYNNYTLWSLIIKISLEEGKWKIKN